jgi:hypothetical protein
MQCPVCGSERKMEEKKCNSCGVIYINWVKKIVTRLEMKTKQIQNETKKNRISTEQYKEVINQI